MKFLPTLHLMRSLHISPSALKLIFSSVREGTFLNLFDTILRQSCLFSSETCSLLTRESSEVYCFIMFFNAYSEAKLTLNRSMKKETQLTHFASDPDANHGIINPPIYRASTLAFPNLASYEKALKDPYHNPYYGRLGTPTVHELEKIITELEGGYRSIMMPSGLAAANIALLALLKNGDELLMVDSVYGHVREFCDEVLTRYHIKTTYYNPLLEDGIEQLITKKTRLIYLESPGSNTFECQNFDALIKIAKTHNLKVLHDSTWATPLLLKNFTLGVNVTIHSCTKFFSGHADVMGGTIVCDEENYESIKDMTTVLGQYVSPDECYLISRGLRTLHTRLPLHEKNAITVANWLEEQPEVLSILHPDFSSCPGHEHFKKYYQGSSGLFSFVLNSDNQTALAAFIDNLTLIRLGQSWGGYESLVLPVYPKAYRTYQENLLDGQYVRLFIGLENTDDIIQDLETGLNAYRKVVNRNDQNNQHYATG